MDSPLASPTLHELPLRYSGQLVLCTASDGGSGSTVAQAASDRCRTLSVVSAAQLNFVPPPDIIPLIGVTTDMVHGVSNESACCSELESLAECW